MYVGTPVIATDWSGNTEFMNSDTACMVGYDMIELDKDYEPSIRVLSARTQLLVPCHAYLP